MTADIHTCSYYCERPGCIRAQRDYLAAQLTAAQQPTEGEEIMVKTPNDVMFILPLQPSGRSIGPRFVVHVPLIEAPAVKALQAEIEALRAEVERVTCELMDAITRADKLEEALRELVDLKDNVKHSFPNDYAVRKPLAWDKARALLRDQEEGHEQ